MQTLTWSTPELKVVLELARAGDLCGGLGVAMERPTRTELGQAVAARRTAARATFEGQAAHAAIVEIDRVFKVAHDDPKFVIRLGSADAGVLTQFIQTADQDTRLAKERPHRARQSWLDLLRQLGSARVPRPVLSSRLGEDLQYIAVWAINRQRRSATNPRVWRPIAIRYRPFSAEPIEGWQDEDRCWVPYRSFLLWLAQDAKAQSPDDEYSEVDKASDEDSRWSRDRRQRETMAFLRHLVAAQQGRPTVLMAHAQNFRSDWPWLGNTSMTMDRIDLGDGDDVPVSLWGNDLHVVRVRDSQGDETPQYYGRAGSTGSRPACGRPHRTATPAFSTPAVSVPLPAATQRSEPARRESESHPGTGKSSTREHLHITLICWSSALPPAPPIPLLPSWHPMCINCAMPRNLRGG
nr:RNaseH domain-containing protein [Actinomadura sp. J1-007]